MWHIWTTLLHSECEYKCEADDVCISKELVCDGMPSCSDEQDEKDCGKQRQAYKASN